MFLRLGKKHTGPGVIYFFIRWLFAVLFRILLRWDVTGTENVPEEGGAIIVSNHVSLLDPPAVSAALRRPTVFMAKQELFTIPVVGWVIRRVNTLPVRRDRADRRAIREGMRVLSEGRLLALFPEGTRRTSGSMGAPHLGAALFALKTGCPVVPVAVIGTGGVLRKGTMLPRLRRIRVRIGRPLHFEQAEGERVEREVLEETTTQIMREIQRLLDEASSSSSPAIPVDG